MRGLVKGVVTIGAFASFVACRPSFETVTEWPKRPRHPDGVSLEPAPTTPAPAFRAPANGVVALREPFVTKKVELAVRALVRALENADMTSLQSLTAGGGTPSSTSHHELLRAWMARVPRYQREKAAGTRRTELAAIARVRPYLDEDDERPSDPTSGSPRSPRDSEETRDQLVRVEIDTAASEESAGSLAPSNPSGSASFRDEFVVRVREDVDGVRIVSEPYDP